MQLPRLPSNIPLTLLSTRSAALAVSASDDCTAKLWDTRVRGEVGCLTDNYQLTAVAYANDGNVVYTGGIDNCITAWDVRQMHKSMTMKGHTGEEKMEWCCATSAFFVRMNLIVCHCLFLLPHRYHHMSCTQSQGYASP
jgi:WD40 repeat protein